MKLLTMSVKLLVGIFASLDQVVDRAEISHRTTQDTCNDLNMRRVYGHMVPMKLTAKQQEETAITNWSTW